MMVCQVLSMLFLQVSRSRRHGNEADLHWPQSFGSRNRAIRIVQERLASRGALFRNGQPTGDDVSH